MDPNLLKNDLAPEEKNKELSYCEEYLRIIVKSSLDGISVVDDQGKFEFANDSFFRIIEWPREEIVGNYFQKIIPEEMNEFSIGQWKNVMEGIPDDFETKIITKSGQIKFVKVAHTLTKIKGKMKVVSVTKDITKNKKFEITLKESEEKYKDLFENAQDTMFVIDMNGNFSKMNKNGLLTLGYSKEEVIGSNISKFVTSESLKIVKECLKKSPSEEIADQKNILEVVCKNGEHRWVEIKARDIKDGYKKIEIHGIARDITENIRLKQQLRKSNNQKKLLCHLIDGTRGGRTRAFILRHLSEKSYNAHQLAKVLNKDYKTIVHHLEILAKKGMITKGQDEYSGLYFIAKRIESDLEDMDILNAR